MHAQLKQLTDEAKAWLLSQSMAPLQSPRWHAYNNFRAFIRAVQAEPSCEGISCAIHILQRQISVHWDWSADYSDKIIDYYQRADRIACEMEVGVSA